MTYIVLVDEDSQARADKRRHELLKKQDEHIREVFRKRIGTMEHRPPRDRRAFFAAHEPVFLPAYVNGMPMRVTLDEWLDAADHEDARMELLRVWGGVLAQFFDVYPPEGQPPQQAIDPQTGQPVMVAPGSPNYALRQTLWMKGRERALQGPTGALIDLAGLLSPYWRERFLYDPRRIVAQLKDLRRLAREGTRASSNGSRPAEAETVGAY